MVKSEVHCVFCGSDSVTQTHSKLYHTFKKDHGPFEFSMCRSCGSGLTVSPPSAEKLASLYASYRDGLPDLHRAIMLEDPQNELYHLCARRMLKHAAGRTAPIWVDVGAGGGELSRILSSIVPKGRGIALDLHERPERLDDAVSVDWICADINEPGFSGKLGLAAGADLVISTAVWEHVNRPDLYARDLLGMLRPGGVLYLMCPNYGSLARKVMGRRWPYFTPGEHLNMPTPKGAVACLRRAWASLDRGRAAPTIRSAPLALPYSLRYVFRRFGFNAIGKMLPPRIGIPLPAGALEAILVAPE